MKSVFIALSGAALGAMAAFTYASRGCITMPIVVVAVALGVVAVFALAIASASGDSRQ